MRAWQGFKTRLRQSIVKAQTRATNIPAIHYPEHLPVVQAKDDIVQAIKDHPVVIISGATGSGKTTQLPKFCLEAGLGVFGKIAHTQPRRIAARTVADRVAKELATPLGELVGYQVRFEQQVSDANLIELCTDGLLLNRLTTDRYLNQYDTIIVDEAHERSLNIDFLLGVLKALLKRRKDLKIIITSATIDVQRFSGFFNGAPIFEVTGRTYPVDIHYRGPSFYEDDQPSLELQILQLVEEIYASPSVTGDTLVFLPGEQQIRQVAHLLRRKANKAIEVLPLYARLAIKAQAYVFKPGKLRRVILATNVAETSLTVPNIGFVIDLGKVRMSRYSVRQKIQQLPIEPISQASANQRAGRCGRVMNGICYRLYDEDDFNARSEFNEPEIKRTNLANVILQMLHLRLGRLEDFEFLEQPDAKLVRDGYQLLLELGAVNKQEANFTLTALGETMARFPLDPRIARLLLAASDLDCLSEMLVVASALSVADVRQRPYEKRQAADAAHQQFQDASSDFISDIKLYKHLAHQQIELSRRAFVKYCEVNFISYVAWLSWRDTYRQLRQACLSLNLKFNKMESSSETLHRAVLSAFATQIAVLDTNVRQGMPPYLSTRNRRCAIHPSSALSQFKVETNQGYNQSNLSKNQGKKAMPKWWVAASMVETERLLATKVAVIEPEWVLPWVKDWVKTRDSEPVWDAKNGFVRAQRETQLLGLSLTHGERVNFSKANPQSARACFLQAALVEGQLFENLTHQKSTAFLQHNQALCEKIEMLEQKNRRTDLLADESERLAFFDERIPQGVADRASFLTWWKSHVKKAHDYLHYDESWLLATDQLADANQFPDVLCYQDQSYALQYEFSLGAQSDGVVLKLPLDALFKIPEALPDWLVPGLLPGKCEALIRGLPKQQRKYFMPIGPFVTAFLSAGFERDQPLALALTTFAARMKGAYSQQLDWPVDLPHEYQMMIHVQDAKGQLLAQGVSVNQLRRELYKVSNQWARDQAQQQPEIAKLSEFVYQSWPQDVEFSASKAGARLCLRAVEAGVVIDHVADEKDAQTKTFGAMIKLCSLRIQPQLKRWHKSHSKAPWFLFWMSCFDSQQAAQAWLEVLICQRVFLWNVLSSFSQGASFPWYSQQAFEQMLAEGMPNLGQEMVAIDEILKTVAAKARQVQKQLDDLPISFQQSAKQSLLDLQQQRQYLMAPSSLQHVAPWVDRLPFYWCAMQLRLERLVAQVKRDQQQMLSVRRVTKAWLAEGEKLTEQQRGALLWREIGWHLQEYRISIFAQPMKTKFPVSEQRILRKICAVYVQLNGF